MNKNKNIFYVYAYLDPRKPGTYVYGDYSFEYEPFYIGKGGTKRQIKRHLFESKERTKNTLKYNKIQKIIRETSQNPIILKIRDNIVEQEAFDIEASLIKKIGRIDLQTGPLTNHWDGHFGGTANPSQETRKKLGDATRGKTYEEIYGKKKAKELRQSRVESNKRRILSIETKDKIRKKHAKRFWKLTKPNGEKIIIKNLNQFCFKNNLTMTLMCHVAQGKQTHHKGWGCEYC